MNRTADVAWMAAVVAGAVLLGMLTLSSPTVPSEPSADEFSADRALEHVAVIARAPHPIGSPENRAVRQYLGDELEGLGLPPTLQTVRVPDYYGPAGRIVDVVNVMARIPGSQSSGATVLMAHYDTIPATPGANDNAAGVAVVLETAEMLLAGRPLGNDVILLFTDGEEPAPRYGSSAFVNEHPWMEDVAFVVNIEAMGGSGPSVVVETGEAQAWTLGRLAAAAQRPVAFSFVTATVELFGEIGTDFVPFVAAGAEGIHVAYARGSSLYHTPYDVPGAVDRRSVQHHGDYALGLVRELGDVDWATEPASERATFFTAWPGVLVRYRDIWTIPLAVAALGAAFAALVAECQGRRRRLGVALAQAGRMLLGIVVVALLATPVWMAIAAMRQRMGVGEAYLWLVVLTATGMLIRTRFTRRHGPRPASAIVAVWAVLAMATAYGLPGAAYLFTWPAIVAGVVLVAWREGGVIARRLRLFSVAAVTSLMLVPAVDIFFALAQPRPGNRDSEMTEMFMVVAFFVVLAVELLVPFARGPGGRPDDEGAESVAAAPDMARLAA